MTVCTSHVRTLWVEVPKLQARHATVARVAIWMESLCACSVSRVDAESLYLAAGCRNLYDLNPKRSVCTLGKVASQSAEGH